jgi:hypothetical protein
MAHFIGHRWVEMEEGKSEACGSGQSDIRIQEFVVVADDRRDARRWRGGRRGAARLVSPGPVVVVRVVVVLTFGATACTAAVIGGTIVGARSRHDAGKSGSDGQKGHHDSGAVIHVFSTLRPRAHRAQGLSRRRPWRDINRFLASLPRGKAREMKIRVE